MRRCIASKVASAFASRVISEITLAVGQAPARLWNVNVLLSNASCASALLL